MFDLHLTHIIANGVKYYGTDRALFDPLFPNIAEAMRQRMFNGLSTRKVHFDLAFSNKVEGSLPLITIENNEHFYDSQGLGDMSGEFIDGEGRKSTYSHIFTSQECIINIFADNMEMVRCLQGVVTASVLLFKTALIKANYENILYLGATPIRVEDPVLKGGSVLYGRQMRYGALHHLLVPSRVENLSDIGAPDTLYEVEVETPKPY